MSPNVCMCMYVCYSTVTCNPYSLSLFWVFHKECKCLHFANVSFSYLGELRTFALLCLSVPWSWVNCKLVFYCWFILQEQVLVKERKNRKMQVQNQFIEQKWGILYIKTFVIEPKYKLFLLWHKNVYGQMSVHFYDCSFWFWFFLLKIIFLLSFPNWSVCIK